MPRSRRNLPMASCSSRKPLMKWHGRQRDEPRVFVHLAHHVLCANHAEAARVEQAHFDALCRQRHPRINVRGIIVVVNEDVVAPAEFQPGGDEAQRERGWADERDFVRLAVQQLRAEPARVVQPVHHKSLLVAERALLRAFGNRAGHAARQRADAGVREENFVARDGKFAPAQFLVRQDFSKVMCQKLSPPRLMLNSQNHGWLGRVDCRCHRGVGRN